MTTARRRHSPRKGQAFVEASLVMVVFFAVFIAILDFGQVLYFHQALTERARATARFAAVTAYTDLPTAAKNFAVYGRPDPPAGYPPMIPGLDASKVAVTLFGAAGEPNAHIRIDITNFVITFFTPGLAKVMNTNVHVTMPYEVPAPP